MSDRRELHERIAETFEPKPILTDAQKESVNTWTFAESETRAWVIDGRGGVFDWQALDPDTNEFANALLLEAMPMIRLTRDGDYWEAEADWRFFHTEVVGVNRKTVIVDAYAKWKQLV